MESKEALKNTLEDRAKGLDREIVRRLLGAQEVVVFGSFASSLNGPSSDLDIFCIGERRTHFKSPKIEILILPDYDAYSDTWLGSELANHISSFGVPLGSRPEWFDLAKLDPVAVVRKETRISAYIRSLNAHWQVLSTVAKSRYEIKIRREFQRLQILKEGKPIPPTRILDLEFRGRIDISTPSFRGIDESQKAEISRFFPNSLRCLDG